MGLLRGRPIRAMFPFVFIGKEVERRAQHNEDIILAEQIRPRTYAPRQTANTRPADAGLILRTRKFGLRPLMRESGASQHAIERFLDGNRVHHLILKHLRLPAQRCTSIPLVRVTFWVHVLLRLVGLSPKR